LKSLASAVPEIQGVSKFKSPEERGSRDGGSIREDGVYVVGLAEASKEEKWP